jgi:TonB family protein
MFEAFQGPAIDPTARKRAAASTGLAVVAYGVVAGLVLAIAGRAPLEKAEQLLEVSFQRVIPRAEPPPPPPRPIPKPRRRVALPAPAPAPPRVVVPREIPKEAPRAERTNIPQGALAVTGGVTSAGGGMGGEGAVDLPEEATAPQPLTQDLAPAYPEQARATGKEGLVILKFVVTREGRVANIKVLKGEPPFVDAAIAKVKTILFKPATVNGLPIAVFKIMRFPFRLSVGG